MVPADPRPRLVLRHAQVTLGVLEDSSTLCRVHATAPALPGGRCIGVADVVLDLGLLLQGPPATARSACRLRRDALPTPAPRRTRTSWPFGTLAHQGPPVLGRQCRRRRGHAPTDCAARLRRYPALTALGRDASAGSSVQTVVLTGTSTTYRFPNVSSSSRKSPLRPYSSSAVIQSRATSPGHRRPDQRRGDLGLGLEDDRSGIWALARRSRHAGLSSHHDSGK